jgi:transcription elongation factor GreA
VTETLITPAGLERLNGHLDRLRGAGREEIARRLRQAAATDADRSANVDYLAALEEQAALEARILELERRLATARVAEPNGDDDVVDLGELVLLRDLDTAERISVDSPLGRALVGRRRGETVHVEAPKGVFGFEIVRIEPALRAA